MKYSPFLSVSFILFFLLGISHSHAQSVSTSKDSVFASGFTSTSEFDFADIYGSFFFKNVNADTDSFRWKRVFNNLPDPTWESAVCDIYLCHGTGVDSSDFIMAKGDSGMFYAHFYPDKVGGVGEMVIEIYNIQNPEQLVRIYAQVTAWDKLNAVATIEMNPIFFYPNPANQQIQLTLNDQAILSIKTLSGQLLQSQSLSSGAHVVDVSSLHAGVYIVEVARKGLVQQQRLIKQ